MTDPYWRITVHETAERGLRALRQTDPCGIEEIDEVMAVLALEVDPRRPRNRRLNVCPLRDTRGDWHRVRTFRGNYRILFRVLQKRGRRVVEVHALDRLLPGAKEQALQIVHADERAHVYEPLRGLYRKLGGGR